MTDSPKQGRGRTQFLLVAALFFAPVIAAYLYYFAFPEWRPQEKTHHGELLDPARPLPPLQLRGADGAALAEDALKGKWTLLYLGDGACEQACEERIFQVRQIRTLLNQHRDRARRVYAATDAAALAAARVRLGAQHPDLVYLDAKDSGLRDFLSPREPHAIYLIDPFGNWLMTYPASAAYQGILKDLKKLMRHSQIG